MNLKNMTKSAEGTVKDPGRNLRKLFKSTLNNRLHRNLACVIDKSSRSAKLKRAFEELPKFGEALQKPPCQAGWNKNVLFGFS